MPAPCARRVVILYHNHGRLANQLWNYASVVAYCLEKGYALENPSFFEYARAFRQSHVRGWREWLFFRTYYAHGHRRLGRLWYMAYVFWVRIFLAWRVLRVRHDETHDENFYLPPTDRESPSYEREREWLETTASPTVYFDGWLFRNPVGLTEHREAIVEYFRPAPAIERRVGEFMKNVRAHYQHVVGVHVRRGDYRAHEGGIHYREPREVARILADYLKHTRQKYVGFVICSDEPIDPTDYAGLPIVPGPGREVDDLFTLAATDLVIGSNSTYGAFASYYGDIPAVVFPKGTAAWNAVDAKIGKGYTENPDFTMVHY